MCLAERGQKGRSCRQGMGRARATGLWDTSRGMATPLPVWAPLGPTRGNFSFPEPEQGLYLPRALVSISRACKDFPSSSSLCQPFRQLLLIPCLYPAVLRSRFALFKKEQRPFPHRCFAVRQRRAVDGRRAGSESTVTFSTRLCWSSALAEELFGGFRVRLLCATAAL